MLARSSKHNIELLWDITRIERRRRRDSSSMEKRKWSLLVSSSHTLACVDSGDICLSTLQRLWRRSYWVWWGVEAESCVEIQHLSILPCRTTARQWFHVSFGLFLSAIPWIYLGNVTVEHPRRKCVAKSPLRILSAIEYEDKALKQIR
jgi:hypothetical protein